MYKKIENYCNCDIYKHITAGIWISAFKGKKIAQGSYVSVTDAALQYMSHTR